LKLSVVIAVYDERENLVELIRRLHAVLPIVADDWEILLVVEGTDGSKDIAEALASELGRIRVMYSPSPSGLGRAFRRGFDAVAGDADAVATMDADLNHQPEELPRLVACLRSTNADIVIGSRFIKGSRVDGTPLWKLALSGILNVLMRHLYGLSIHDKTSGYRVYRADALERISFESSDFACTPEILLDATRQRMRIVEEPIHFVYRTRGTSKMRIFQTSGSYVKLLIAHRRRVRGRRASEKTKATA
jgi:dolichol-phosphate mannosyltransferase